jgi:hypothetical protein
MSPISNQWSITQAKFFRDQGLDSRYNTGERWTSHIITFVWTQGHILWKDRCTSAHAPAAYSLDKSSARTRQTAQNVMTMTYASSPLMLAIDRRIFNIPLEERLQARTSDIDAWTRKCSQSSASVLVRRRAKSEPAAKTSVLISLTRQRNMNATQRSQPQLWCSIIAV